MTLKKSTLNLANPVYPLEILEQEGVLIHRQPLRIYRRLQVSDVVAGKDYRFTLSSAGGEDLLPIILGAYNSGNNSINPASSFTLKMYEGTNYLWGLNLANKKTIVDSNLFYFTFPEMPISHEDVLILNSSETLTRVIIYCIPCLIDDKIIRPD